VTMNIEEVCRVDNDVYDYVIWFLMKYVKIDKLWKNGRTLVKWWIMGWWLSN